MYMRQTLPPHQVALSALVVIVVLLVLLILVILLVLVAVLIILVRHIYLLLCRYFTALP